MKNRTYWFEGILLTAVPVSSLVFIPSLSNAFLVKQPLAALLISLALGFAAFQTRVRPSVQPLFLLGAGIYGASALWSATTASNLSLAWHDCLLQFLFLGLFILGAAGLCSMDFPKKFAATAVGCSVVISLLGIAQWFFPSDLNFDLQALGKMKVFSTLGNPNYVACYLVAVLPSCFYLFQQEGPKIRRVFWGVAGGLGLVCLVLTDSRSGWLALAFSVLVGLFFRVNQEKQRQLLVIGFVSILLMAFFVGLSTHTGRGRFMIWAESLDIWKHHPLGVGWENFNIHQLEAQNNFFQIPSHVQEYGQNAAFVFDAHNEALNTFVETGPLGLLGWLMLVGLTVWKGYSKSKENPVYRSWYMGWMAVLFFSLWNTILFYSPLALLFWLGAGFLVSPSSPKEPGLTTKPLSSFIRIGGIIVAVVIFIFTCYWGVRDTRAADLEHQGDILLSTGPFDKDVELYRQSLALNPENGFALQKLGLALYFNNQFAEALDTLHKAQPLFGDIAVPYLEAEILAKQRHFPEAVELYQFISGAFPNHVTPPFMLGQIYLKLGSKDKAKTQFQKVLDIPESPYNLRLDFEKIRKQKELSKAFLSKL